MFDKFVSAVKLLRSLSITSDELVSISMNPYSISCQLDQYGFCRVARELGAKEFNAYAVSQNHLRFIAGDIEFVTIVDHGMESIAKQFTIRSVDLMDAN